VIERRLMTSKSQRLIEYRIVFGEQFSMDCWLVSRSKLGSCSMNNIDIEGSFDDWTLLAYKHEQYRSMSMYAYEQIKIKIKKTCHYWNYHNFASTDLRDTGNFPLNRRSDEVWQMYMHSFK